MQDKEQIRRWFRSQREACSAETLEHVSRAVYERILSLPFLEHVNHIAGYSAFRNEIDISGILEAQLEAGKSVYLPRVLGPFQMTFVKVIQKTPMVPNQWGISEPVGEPAPLELIELVLLPGLAFDKNGGRLGFGMGFYDRILGEMIQEKQKFNHPSKPLFVGVCHHWQLLDEPLSVEAHDIAVDIVVSDQAIIYCSDRFTSP